MISANLSILLGYVAVTAFFIYLVMRDNYRSPNAIIISVIGAFIWPVIGAAGIFALACIVLGQAVSWLAVFSITVWYNIRIRYFHAYCRAADTLASHADMQKLHGKRTANTRVYLRLNNPLLREIHDYRLRRRLNFPVPPFFMHSWMFFSFFRTNGTIGFLNYIPPRFIRRR